MTGSIPTTYLTPKNRRPSRATLSKSLRFKVPSRFAKFVCQLYDFANGDRALCLDAFDAALGLFPKGPDARYPATPPELFPVGSTGCDGDHYGFLLHAPELELDELPFCHYCPMDSDGVIVVGSSTEQGLASVMAHHLSYDFLSADEKKLIVDIATACNIRPQVEPNPFISVPKGWHFLPSSDGVGTLAPAKWFASLFPTEYDRYQSPDPFVAAADVATSGGFLGTALHYLREGLWFFWSAKPFTLAHRMVEVYNLMNRVQLADELTLTMNRWREGPDA